MLRKLCVRAILLAGLAFAVVSCKAKSSGHEGLDAGLPDGSYLDGDQTPDAADAPDGAGVEDAAEVDDGGQTPDAQTADAGPPPFCQGKGGPQWAKNVDAPSRVVNGNGIAAGPGGTFYTTGSFEGTATFGPGEPNETPLTVNGNPGFSDIFIAKHTSDGSLIWAVQAGGPGHDSGNGIAVAANGDVVVTGCFSCYGLGSNSATFGPGDATEITLNSAGDGDVFVARYLSDGELIWAEGAGGPGDDESRGIAVAPDGSLTITGRFIGTNITFGAGAGSVTLNDSSNWDFFVARYTGTGSVMWAKSASVVSAAQWVNVEGHGIGATPNNDAVVAGYFGVAMSSGNTTVTFGPGEAGATPLDLAAGNGSDVFVARFDPNGLLVWAKRQGGDGGDSGEAVAVAPDGTSYVTGSFETTAVFGPNEPGQKNLSSHGAQDIFTARLDLDGSLMWAERAGGPSTCGFGVRDGGFGIALTAGGTVLTSGHYSGTINFGDVPICDLEGKGWGNVFVAGYDATGQFLWAESVLIGDDVCVGASNRPVVAAASDNGSALVLSEFSGTPDFGNPNIVINGWNDIFVVRYPP